MAVETNIERSIEATETALTPPPFTISSLWGNPSLDPLTGKSYTIPIFNLRSKHGVVLHLAWIGFFSAFFAWFAFSALTPETVKADLNLTSSKSGTAFIIRIIAGPLCDRYGPRKVMAGLLLLGAIPSGLAGAAHDAGSLYVIRFFIGILGGTFVPCQAWTTAWFHPTVVGRANSLSGGWGNLGGGVTFAVMVALYQRLVDSGLRPHVAWRVSFVCVPVPLIIVIAILILLVGQDHPNGDWSKRNEIPPSALVCTNEIPETHDEDEEKKTKTLGGETRAVAVSAHRCPSAQALTAVPASEPLSWHSASAVILSPLTWLPALAYLISFGLELGIEANLPTVYYKVFDSKSFTQIDAGYLASIFGFLNRTFFTRFTGGLLADMLYKKTGKVSSKKWLTLGLCFGQGVFLLGCGMYMTHAKPSVGGVTGLIVLIAFCCEMANGTNFAMVPHLNPSSNGMMSGIVGSMGNLGGVIFALIWRL